MKLTESDLFTPEAAVQSSVYKAQTLIDYLSGAYLYKQYGRQEIALLLVCLVLCYQANGNSGAS